MIARPQLLVQFKGNVSQLHIPSPHLFLGICYSQFLTNSPQVSESPGECTQAYLSLSLLTLHLATSFGFHTLEAAPASGPFAQAVQILGPDLI